MKIEYGISFWIFNEVISFPIMLTCLKNQLLSSDEAFPTKVAGNVIPWYNLTVCCNKNKDIDVLLKGGQDL